MSTWSKDELRKIAETDDLHISPFREDGRTYGTTTWIWSVVVDDGLYVRGYNGQKSRWYQAAVRQKAGRITAAGITREVAFEPVDGTINDRIDEAYVAKYKGSSYLKPMISTRARSATVKVMPRQLTLHRLSQRKTRARSTSRGVVRNSRSKGPPSTSLARYRLSHFFLCTIHRAQAVGRSRSHPARGVHGIRIRLAKP